MEKFSDILFVPKVYIHIEGLTWTCDVHSKVHVLYTQ